MCTKSEHGDLPVDASARTCMCACTRNSKPLADALPAEQTSIPLQLMALRPGTVEAHIPYRDGILAHGPLSEKERALVQLSAAVSLRLGACIPRLVKRAKKVGVSRDEVVQVTLLAGYQAGNSLLHTAFEGIAGD
jgi:alkylhydroperoxidase/carboxymuconolactone decarboxylase family protein YurZ